MPLISPSDLARQAWIPALAASGMVSALALPGGGA